jgi:RNA-directed DNA polymerase
MKRKKLKNFYINHMKLHVIDRELGRISYLMKEGASPFGLDSSQKSCYSLKANISISEVTIPSKGIVSIGTGITLEVPEGYEAEIVSRMGLVRSFGIIVLGAPYIIDEEYSTEIKVTLQNNGDNEWKVKKGEEIALVRFRKKDKVEIRDEINIKEKVRVRKSTKNIKENENKDNKEVYEDSIPIIEKSNSNEKNHEIIKEDAMDTPLTSPEIVHKDPTLAKFEDISYKANLEGENHRWNIRGKMVRVTKEGLLYYQEIKGGKPIYIKKHEIGEVQPVEQSEYILRKGTAAEPVPEGYTRNNIGRRIKLPKDPATLPLTELRKQISREIYNSKTDEEKQIYNKRARDNYHERKGNEAVKSRARNRTTEQKEAINKAKRELYNSKSPEYKEKLNARRRQLYQEKKNKEKNSKDLQDKDDAPRNRINSKNSYADEVRKEEVLRKLRILPEEIGNFDVFLPRSFIKTKEVEEKLIRSSQFIPNKEGEPEHFKISLKSARDIAKEVFTSYFDTEKILAMIRKKSEANLEEKFEGLYSLLFREDNINAAIAKLKGNKGTSTAGIDKVTIDAMNNSNIAKLMKQLKNREFQFKPVRKIMIPKPGKAELRPLGIPTWYDRIVQEMIRGILDAIYEPIFKIKHKDSNYGFRPGVGTFQTIDQLLKKAQGMDWVIEGDIKSAFPTVNHEILRSLLEKKIKDKEFLNLITQGLKAGTIHEGHYEHTLLGTPQGGIASPILFNIYMAEFDEYILKVINEKFQEKNRTESRKTEPINLLYTRIGSKITSIKNKINKVFTQKYLSPHNYPYKIITKSDKNFVEEQRKKIRYLAKVRFKLPYVRQERKELRYYYTRYADDWVFLTNASREYTEEIKNDFEKFLLDKLKFTLSKEKTKITDIAKDTFQFLGFSLGKYATHRKITKVSKKRKITLNKVDRTYKAYGINEKMTAKEHMRRTTGQFLMADIDRKRMENRLIFKQFINKSATRGVRKKPWEILELPKIIEQYNAIIRGIVLYYAPLMRDFSRLNKYIYLLNYSCYHTLASKYRTSLRKIMKKYGKPISIEEIDKEVVKEQTNAKTSREIRQENIQVKDKRNYKKNDKKIKDSEKKKKIYTLLDYEGAKNEYIKIKEKQTPNDDDFLSRK